MLDNGIFRGSNEKFIEKVQKAIIRLAIQEGHDVVVDNTHLNHKKEKELFDLANELKADFEIEDFTHVSVEECIQRDKGRKDSVGERVILKFYNQYLSTTRKIKPDPTKYPAIICDIDGTLAHTNGRSPYDYSKVLTDTLDKNVRGILEKYALSHHIILVSGREDSCKNDTVRWIEENGIPYDRLMMRKAGDKRRDDIVKEEIFLRDIDPQYSVDFVLDDRDRVVYMWRRLGLQCLQVAEGDF